MPSPLLCPTCGKQYSPKPQWAGRKLKCQCGALIHVPPGPPPPPAQPDIEPIVRVLSLVRNDTGPFFTRLSHLFFVNDAHWSGAVILSATGIYFLKGHRTYRKQILGAVAGGVVAGAIGGAVVGMMNGPATKAETLATCKCRDLPDALRKALDPKGKRPDADVILVPKSTVSSITFTGLEGWLRLQAGSDEFTASTGPLGHQKFRLTLASMGWLLDKNVTPADRPVHDTRTPEEIPQPKTLSKTAKIVIGVVIAIILACLIAVAAFVNLAPK